MARAQSESMRSGRECDLPCRGEEGGWRWRKKKER
jgi:hypothetical protein